MKKLLLLASIAMTVSACLAGQNSSQQAAADSNIGTYVQEKSGPISPIPAYEVTVADLVNTPWDVSSPKNTSSWSNPEKYDGAQLLKPLSITLEKGQDLLIHLGNPEGLWNGGITKMGPYPSETNEVKFDLYTLNSGGWVNFLSPIAKRPLDADFQLMENEQYITYHLKNNHAGETRLEMVYCIDDNGIIATDRCSGTGKKINVKNIFVTTK
ncbi:MAG: hypothetical protein K2W97_08960 [Chthoniobacterales bacterium]|nr:hypothetical protein [Chthoniobacterales bacterium]